MDNKNHGGERKNDEGNKSSNSFKGLGFGYRALVVESNSKHLMYIQMILKYHQYEVRTAQSEREAFSLLKENQHLGGFDVVLVDDLMPGMKGFALMQSIMYGFGIHVVLMSADPIVETRYNASHLSYCHFILKPIKYEGEIKNIWKYAFKAKINGNTDEIVENVRKRARHCRWERQDTSTDTISSGTPNLEVENKENEEKKRSLKWDYELHNNFLDAVYEIGLENAGPRLIELTMNKPGLTRPQIASHWQKFRNLTKKLERENEEIYLGPKRMEVEPLTIPKYVSDYQFSTSFLEKTFPRFREATVTPNQQQRHSEANRLVLSSLTQNTAPFGAFPVNHHIGESMQTAPTPQPPAPVEVVQEPFRAEEVPFCDGFQRGLEVVNKPSIPAAEAVLAAVAVPAGVPIEDDFFEGLPDLYSLDSQFGDQR